MYIYVVKNHNIYYFNLETKSQFARDDPAFLVLLVVCLCGKILITEKTCCSSFIVFHTSDTLNSDICGARIDNGTKLFADYFIHFIRSACGLHLCGCYCSFFPMGSDESLLAKQ